MSPASAVVQLHLLFVFKNVVNHVRGDVADARANRVDVQGKRDEHRLGALQVVEPAVRHGTRVFELRLFTKRVQSLVMFVTCMSKKSYYFPTVLHTEHCTPYRAVNSHP